MQATFSHVGRIPPRQGGQGVAEHSVSFDVPKHGWGLSKVAAKRDSLPPKMPLVVEEFLEARVDSFERGTGCCGGLVPNIDGCI
eukprot:4832544-Pyramimonas_sp.AAC.1